MTRLIKIVFKLLFPVAFLTFCYGSAQVPTAPPAGASKNIHYDIEMTLSFEQHSLSGTAKLNWDKNNVPSKLRLILHRNLEINSIALNDKPLSHQRTNHNLPHLSWITIDTSKEKGSLLTIEYEGRMQLKSPVQSMSEMSSGDISQKGAYLSDGTGWYPIVLNNLAHYRLKVSLPETYQAVCEGRVTSNKVNQLVRVMTFQSEHPLQGLTLACAKYVVKSVNHKGIEIATYFSKENQDLSHGYLEHSKSYIDLYQNMIGDYPYSKFYVVENYLQTGFGMPSFTLIGDRVLRLPFIVKTSLGHEILHNWWGNSVYIDKKSGNWCEGLTNYLADYHYKEISSSDEAIRYRRNILKNYTHYVNANNDFPLSKFTQRNDFKSMTIGYGKGMMVFHMLRRLIRDNDFYSGLKSLYKSYQFKYLGWAGIERHFEKVCKRELSWFFKQWVYESGAAELSLTDVKQKKSQTHYELTFTLSQKGNYYLVDIPIAITTGTVTRTYKETLAEKEKKIVMNLSKPADKLEIDPNCEIFRKLAKDEIPPAFSLIYSDKGEKVLVYPDNGKSPVDFGKREEQHIKAIGSKGKNYLNAGKTLIVAGSIKSNSFYKAINPADEIILSDSSFSVKGKSYSAKDQTLIFVMKNPNNSKGIMVIYPLSKEISPAILRKLRHYQDYGYLVFSGSQVIDKGELPVKRHALMSELTY